MNEQNKSDEKSPQVTSGFTIIAVILGLFFLQDTILNPTRPGMIDTDQWFAENIRARLWQDPFEVVSEHIGKNKKPYQDIAEQLKNIAEQRSERETDEEVFPEFKKHPFPATPEKAIESAQHPMRVCYRDGLYESGEEAAHSIQELGCQIANTNVNNAVYTKGNKSGEVSILAVMVPGGPYAEDREARLRSRYATISALLAQGYAPEDTDYIGFVHFAKFCKKTINKTIQSQKETPDICNMPAVMPYEWFSAHTNNPGTTKHAQYRPGRILVLWLDNDAFYRADRPLYMIGLLNALITIAYEKTSEIDKKSSTQSDAPLPKINFHVIGPSNSDTLERIYQEVNRLKVDIRDENDYKSLNNSYLFTASATVPNQHLSGNLEEINRTAGYLKRLILKKNMDWLDNTIVRTISTQDKVAHTLLCELALRGVTPYRFKDKESDIKKECELTDLKFDPSGQPSQIALIGEADTYYARMLRHSILEQIQKFDDPAVKTKNNNISFFSYLRGIDGITSQNALPNQEKGKNQEHKTNNPNEKEAKTLLERPIGNSQLDYLLGLGANLKQLEQRNIAEDKGAFKAIGIIGSDAYDKLLILQALRNKFPGIPFFTTDLDARFLHSSETKWTRNLIVVSPFGLQLNTENQNSPPFRDNFQTSLYISILLAMTCGQGYWQCERSVHEPPNGRNGWTHHPRVFEVGNYGAVDMSHTSNSIYINNQSEKPNQNSFPELIVLIFLLSPIFIFFTPKQFHFPIGILTGTLIILYTTITIAFDYYGILNYLNELMPGYFEKPTSSNASVSSMFVEPFSFTNGVSSWPATAIRLLTILLASFLLYRIYKLIKINQEEIREEFILSRTATVHKNHIENKAAKKEFWKSQLSIDNWRTDDSNFEAIWHDYREKAKLGFSIIRILFIFFLFISFIIFIQMFGDKANLIPPAPFRGEFNLDWIYWVALAMTVAYLALILYIADHVHLSSHFIKLLANQPAIIWPVELIKIYKNKYGLPENIVQYKILLDFIHRHTAIHNKFIFYPFICLFLIIMSRNHYFDNWLITPYMVLIYLFFALVTLLSALRLRAAAMHAKKEILRRLNTNSAQSPVCKWRYRKDDNIAKLKSLSAEIENFKEGIFKPLLHHPMILSLLMPFSSVGGVYLIEYLL